jgi:hypothetical protein
VTEFLSKGSLRDFLVAESDTLNEKDLLMMYFTIKFCFSFFQELVILQVGWYI